MPAPTPYLIVLLLALVTLGVGGYAAWAVLVCELGALALFGWLWLTVLFRTSAEERARNLAILRSQRKRSVDVEILTPPGSGGGPGPAGRAFRDSFFLFGYPFRRHGAGLLITLITAWILLSLVPLRAPLLDFLSPKAFELRSEVGALVGAGGAPAPWSLTPFLTFQDLLLWFTYIMLFLVSYHLAESSAAIRRLSRLLLLLGIASGAYGLIQWLSALSSVFQQGAELTGLRATGSFGNRNHYAFFQEMLLLVSLGWLHLRWTEREGETTDRVRDQEAKARSVLTALGIGCIALSLVFSLSRSGVSFAAVGCILFLYLVRGGRAILAAPAAVLLAAVLGIGIDPMLSRFETIPSELAADEGRAVVWRDSFGALGDFWLTGSGLSSFSHVFPIYRSFGGRRFYSWAHNDYLQLAIELGVPGFLLALAITGWAVRRARRVRAQLHGEPALQHLHAGYCAAALAVGLHSFTDFGLRLPANGALFAVIVGVVTGLAPARGSRRKKRRKKWLRRSRPKA